ncbi:MAG: TIGR01906 family membrane protein [Dehalococcoidia bacterium]|nr:TIGR01906 family membrane protein [Dehalococcoidia bacterium]
MTFLSRLGAALFVVAIPLLLVTSNVRFFAGEVRFYERGFREFNADQATGVPLPELDRAARSMIDYFENDSDTLRILVTDDGEEVSLFNARETEHMQDVKQVMRVLFRVNEVALAYVLTYVVAVYLWSGERNLRSLARLSLLGVGLGVVVTGAIGAFAVAGFDLAWTTFHEILFRNDLWQLDPDTDRLIQMFPESFWEESTYIIGIMTFAEATAIVIAATLYLLASRNSNATPTPAPQASREPDRIERFRTLHQPVPPPPPGSED